MSAALRVALKALGNIVNGLTEDTHTQAVLETLKVEPSSVWRLALCLRREALGSEHQADAIESVQLLRRALLQRDDWQMSIEANSLAATLAHTADALLESRLAQVQVQAQAQAQAQAIGRRTLRSQADAA